MTLKLFGLFAVALVLGAVGQLSMKKALDDYTSVHGALQGLGMLLRAMLTPGVAFGLGCFVLSSMGYLMVISKVPLTVAYPMVALNYVIVTVLRYFVYHEPVPLQRVAGLAVIIAGVVLVATSNQPEPATAEPAAAVEAAS
ncbi:MAG: EamA family transporter [Fimbriimonadaceae bacterium]|nr:EamA family transporter [Fimbriimonadaceae bacterium]